MKNVLKRTVASGAMLATTAGLFGALVATAPAAAAAEGPLTIVNQAIPTTQTGNNFSVLGFTTPQACDSQATRHTTKIIAAQATNPADQAEMDKWVTGFSLMYSPVGVGLPGPYTNYTSMNNLQGLANTYGQKLLPGTWTLEFRCQNNLGTTIYDRFRGTVVFDSPTSWHVQAAPKAVSTTTLSADKNSITAGDPVVLTATVAPSAASGEVEFFNGATSLGKATVSAGSASLSTSVLMANASIVAKYLGDTAHAGSDSAPVAITVAPKPAVVTTTTLTANPVSGPANQQVTLSGAVTAANGTVPAGSCDFYDLGIKLGSAPVDGAGKCSITNSSFAGPGHKFTVKFVPTNPAAYAASQSAEVLASYDAPAYLPDDQTIIVTVPKGDLTIVTPYTPANPLNLGQLVLSDDGKCYNAVADFNKVTVKDTRAGNIGWTANLTRKDFVSAAGDRIAADREYFKNVAPQYVAGNALQSITVKDIPSGGGAAATNPTMFASAPSGASVGTVDVLAKFGLDCVPTSTKPGDYTATVTFTIG